MKKVLHIQFYLDTPETLVKDMAVMVAKHNCGKAKLDLVTLQGYFNAHCARYEWKGEANIFGDLLSLRIDENPFINITEHLLIGSIDENNNVTEHQNY